MMGVKQFRCARIMLSGIKLMHTLRKGQMETSKGPSPSAAEQFYFLVISSPSFLSRHNQFGRDRCLGKWQAHLRNDSVLGARQIS